MDTLAAKEKGGLGVSSLFALNRALLMKWFWRFYSHNDSLWSRVIKAIYGVDGEVNEAIRCTKLLLRRLDLNSVMTGFGNMKELQVLYIYSGSNWKNYEASQHFPNSLKYLSWRDYPFSSLHDTFQSDNLVGFDMSFSIIETIRKGRTRKVLEKLKFLDLSYTMMKTFLELQSLSLDKSNLRNLYLRPTPDLELLSLVGCCNLEEFCMPYGCPKLQSLKFDYSKLRNLNLGSTLNLETLNLETLSFDRCDIEECCMPIQCPMLKFLSLHGSKLRNLYLGLTPDLETLSFTGCELEELHMPHACLKLKSLLLDNSLLKKLNGMAPFLERLKKLKSLKLQDCQHLEELTGDFGLLESMEELVLVRTRIKHLPYSICMLKHLKSLKLQHCLHLEVLPRDFGLLESVQELTLFNSKIAYLPFNVCRLKQLKSLKLQDCQHLIELPEEFGQLDSLEEL
ncbi:disease resistance TIR-NBS-LRR class family protein, partial [Tanacetum coccineum]